MKSLPSYLGFPHLRRDSLKAVPVRLRLEFTPPAPTNIATAVAVLYRYDGLPVRRQKQQDGLGSPSYQLREVVVVGINVVGGHTLLFGRTVMQAFVFQDPTVSVPAITRPAMTPATLRRPVKKLRR